MKYFILAVWLLFACSPNLAPERYTPKLSWALTDTMGVDSAGSAWVYEEGHSYLMVVESDDLGRYIRLLDAKDRLKNMAELSQDSVWVKVGRGPLRTRKLQNLERTAGHGKKTRLIKILKPCTLFTAVYAQKNGLWNRCSNQSIELIDSRFEEINYKDIDLRTAYHAKSGQVIVQVRNRSKESIPLFEQGKFMRLSFEGQGKGKHGIHEFKPNVSFLTAHLAQNNLAAESEWQTLLDISVEEILGAKADGTWSFKGSMEEPWKKRGGKIVPEVRFWVQISVKGKRRVGPLMLWKP